MMLLFVVSGLLGGVTSALIWAKSWQDLKKYETFRSVVLGAIGGFIYYLMYSEWSLPNGVVAFAFGYAFQDIVEGLVEKILSLVLKK